MAQTTWTGASGNDDWFDAGNWDTSAVPDASTSIEVDPGNAIISGNAAEGDNVTIRSGGKVTVTGTGSTLTTTETRTDGGAFSIENGGVVTNSSGVVDGIATVSGADGSGNASTWINNGYFVVGEGATGTLNILNGGKVLVNTDASLGQSFRGEALVSGNDSFWENTGRLTIDNGSLRIEDGGRVSNTLAIIGDTSTADVVVTGAASTWVNSGQLTVGSFGTGTMRVEDGATVTSSQGYVGANTGSDGTVTVTGSNSSWEVTDFNLNLGNFGIGSMTIEDGARVFAKSGVYLGISATDASGTLGVNGTPGARGILETSGFRGGIGTADLTIDGGIVRAIANSASFFSNYGSQQVNLGAGGGIIDTNGHDIGIAPVIAGVGSLTKDGLGTLTLTGENTYGGGTTIVEGTLQLGDGGTTGSILGNVTNHGILAFSRADVVTFNGTISGGGSVVKNGAGVLLLTAENSYGGATTVNTGTLLVNGDQSAATGLTTVNSGATLGGGGTIGGDVTIADGGILAPGNSPGTLTINGSLSLAGGSVLDYQFGQADVAGGALNDLVNVGGDLMLDGTLNVSVSSGGTFGSGIYRVFNYDGTLTDNRLELGSMPSGSDVFVQTSIDHQVNLVNTAGLDLNFWDGDAGPKNDGAINGGDGTWHLGGADDNWTEATGAINAPYRNGSFAVFAGASGTVTVDNSGGAVKVAGMQFATDGYAITGDALTLVGPQVTVRVGDGTATGAGYTAIVDAELTGTSQLVKTDLGTLVLTGTNTYTGGTAINGGTVRIASDANLGAAAGGLSFDGGTLNTTSDITSGRSVDLAGAGTFLTDAGTTATLTGSVSGVGSLTKDGAGNLVITGNATQTGGTTISAGMLQVGDGGMTGSILGDVTNNAILAFNRADVVTFGGTISGTGGVHQVGSGKTILTADNTYAGGTTITDGTLELGDGGTMGSILGDVTNQGILAFNRVDVVTFDGTITGAGGIDQIGMGTTILTGDSSALTGSSQVQQGILSVNGVLGGSMGVRGGRLQGIGQVGETTNFSGGTIAPGNSIGMLTVAGNYVGSGGTLEIETVLGDDSSATDKLLVAGDTSGNTNVQVINLGGVGAQTVEGIKIIDVAGVSGGGFTLLGDYVFEGDQAVIAGAYAYRLYQGGVSTPTDGDWYLRSALNSETPLYQPLTPIYEVYAGVLQSFTELDTLQQRLGNRSWSSGAAVANAAVDSDRAGSGMWGRILGRHVSVDPRKSTTGANYDVNIWQLQGGADGELYSGDTGDLIGGLSVRYGTISADVSSIFGDGSITSTGFGLDGSMTWYGNAGLYLDAQANATWYDSDLSSSTVGTRLTSGNDGFGYAFGLEAGQQIALGTNWSVTPQAQLAYSRTDYNDFTDPFGDAVSLKDAHKLRGRLGISADYENSWADRTGQTSRLHAYGIANLHYDLQSNSDVRVSGVKLTTEQDPLWGGLGLGGTYNWGNDKYALYGEATVDTSLNSFGDSYSLTGRIGLNLKF